MLVFRVSEDSSRVTREASDGMSWSELSLFKKWVVSLMYDGSLGASGFNKSTNSDILSVG